jgi:hypothetical protein
MGNALSTVLEVHSHQYGTSAKTKLKDTLLLI